MNAHGDERWLQTSRAAAAAAAPQLINMTWTKGKPS